MYKMNTQLTIQKNYLKSLQIYLTILCIPVLEDQKIPPYPCPTVFIYDRMSQCSSLKLLKILKVATLILLIKILATFTDLYYLVSEVVTVLEERTKTTSTWSFPNCLIHGHGYLKWVFTVFSATEEGRLFISNFIREEDM